jgi:hypothetical protein
MTTTRLLRRRILEKGGLCPIWLAYEEDRPQTLATGEFRPRLMRAFWSRVEAADWSRDQHTANPALHYHVYRLIADTEWVDENSLRRVQYVVSFDDAGERPELSITAGAVAHAFG